MSSHAAAAQLARDGFNELPASERRSWLAITWELVSEPVFLVLIACGAIYVFLGDIQEAMMLLGFVAFIACISLYQEQKTERTLEALRDLASPRALAIRNGSQIRIPGREVVGGDIVTLSEGIAFQRVVNFFMNAISVWTSRFLPESHCRHESTQLPKGLSVSLKRVTAMPTWF